MCIRDRYFWVDLLAGAVTALALAAMTSGRLSALHRLLGSNPATSVGRYSYSVYCIHLPLLWLVWHFGVSRLELSALGTFTALTAAGVPVVLVVSYLFFLVVERPFVRHRSMGELRRSLARREDRGTGPSAAQVIRVQ